LLLVGSKSQLPAPFSKSSQKYKPVSGQRQIAIGSTVGLEDDCDDAALDEFSEEDSEEE